MTSIVCWFLCIYLFLPVFTWCDHRIVLFWSAEQIHIMQKLVKTGKNIENLLLKFYWPGKMTSEFWIFEPIRMSPSYLFTKITYLINFWIKYLTFLFRYFPDKVFHCICAHKCALAVSSSVRFGFHIRQTNKLSLRITIKVRIYLVGLI